MKKISLLLLFVLTAQLLQAQKTFIWCGALIDGVNNEVRKNITIIVEKNKITAVENGFTAAGVRR